MILKEILVPALRRAPDPITALAEEVHAVHAAGSVAPGHVGETLPATLLALVLIHWVDGVPTAFGKGLAWREFLPSRGGGATILPEIYTNK